MPGELDHPRKRLINIGNIDDDECFKWWLVRYLNPADRNPTRITRTEREFAKKLDFGDIKLPVKTRDNREVENRIILILAFLVFKTK